MQCIAFESRAQDWLRYPPGKPAVLDQQAVGRMLVKAQPGGNLRGKLLKATRNKGGARAIRLHRGDQDLSAPHTGDPFPENFVDCRSIEPCEERDPLLE